MAGIFISYRREDSGPYAGRLYDALVHHFDRDRVFLDVDSISPGEDFREVLQRTLSLCKVLLVVIGRQWTTVRDRAGRVRLNVEGDYVRAEITFALENGLRIIPVLVGGAEMPVEEDLPAELQALLYRNAWDLSDRRFHQDVQVLIASIGLAFDGDKTETEGAGTSNQTLEVDASKSAVAGPSLFPLYGVVLGKTPTSQLEKIGSRTSSIDRTTGEPYFTYEVNGQDFSYDEESGICSTMYLTRNTDKMPEQWQKLGLSWDNSYDQWLSVLRGLGYSIEITGEPPSLERSPEELSDLDEGESDNFSASIDGQIDGPTPHRITLDFDFEQGTSSTAGTLYSIFIFDS
jgi:hypothetical protein